MPTPSPDPSRPPASEPHRHRQMAESFGTDAERYDRARPRYPAALIERIVGTAPGTGVLDVGCGTGIAAQQLQAAGATVSGVEPDERMAGLARRRGIEVDVAAFESWDPAGRRFDAVVAGQAWHWIDPVAGAAKAAEVLRPGGLLAAFWNVAQMPPALAGPLAEVCERVLPGAPVDFRTLTRPALDLYSAGFDKAAGGMRQVGAFDDPDLWRFDWERTYTRDAWLDQLPTSGILTRLPPEETAQVLAAVGPVIDGMGGAFTMPYATVAVTALRIP